MAYKYTIQLGATITCDKSYEEVVTDLVKLVSSLGTATTTNLVQVNQWVNQDTMQPQTFNDDGSTYVPPLEVKEIETTEETVTA